MGIGVIKPALATWCSLHRLRAQLMTMRIMQTNELRGLLYEFGFVLPEGHRALVKELPATLLKAEVRLPAILIDSLQEQLRRINELEADIGKIERRLATQLRDASVQDTGPDSRMGSPSAFKDGREFAAWVGLLPKQTGMGGRIR